MCNPWCLEFASLVPPFFQNPARILEVGSCNVNGSMRDVLSECADEYIGVDLFEQLFIQLQRSFFEMRNFVQVLKILPVQSTPSDNIVRVFNRDVCHVVGNFIRFPSGFKIARTCFFFD